MSKAPTQMILGESTELKKRKISSATCRHWGYKIGAFKGMDVQIATYCNESGVPVAQKLRLPNKEFVWLGQKKAITPLYGQWLWRDGGKMVVITEGELDALSVSHVQDNKWPVVSVPDGAQGAHKAVAAALPWLDKFESVVFMFDGDEPGRAAVAECVKLLPPGKAKVASLPLKDASDMLQAGRGADIVRAMWDAKQWRPDGIIDMDIVMEQALKPVDWGVSWPWPRLTELTYGIRTKEIYVLGAGVGIGKTDVFTQIISHFVTAHKEKVGIIYLEQPPAETAKRIAGKICNRQFHVPNSGWTQQELVDGLAHLKDKVHFYNHFGSCDWENIKPLIRYMALSLGCKRIFLDHLTALAAHAEDERRYLDGVMADMGSLVQGLDVSLFVISHLATPEGKPHEEGGRVMSKHFRGSRAIMQWANFMFGLERDQQAEDLEVRCTTTFRVLKDRNTGRGTGEVFYLKYNQDSGQLIETTPPKKEEGGDDGTNDY